MLVDFLMLGNVCLEVTVLVLSFVREGAQLLLEVSGGALGESQTKKHEPKFLVRSTYIASLAELVNTGLSRGILLENLEPSIQIAESSRYSGDLRSFMSSSNSASTPLA